MNTVDDSVSSASAAWDRAYKFINERVAGDRVVDTSSYKSNEVEVSNASLLNKSMLETSANGTPVKDWNVGGGVVPLGGNLVCVGNRTLALSTE